MSEQFTTTSIRKATLADLATALRDQQTRAVDVVVPTTKLAADAGRLLVSGAEVELTDDGVTTTDGVYRPTAVANDQLADTLGIPSRYLRKLHADPHLGMWDTNVNYWLSRLVDKRYLLRALRGDDGGEGTLRAVLSDQYKMIDNLDVLLAALSGIRAAGVPATVESADLTDKRMYVRVASDAVRAYAPTLLERYRSPFTGARGADNPVVFAGFVLTNSEVGHGAFTITPRITVQVCSNGMTMSTDALRKVHLGTQLDDGIIQWSDETQRKNTELITAQTRDAVRTFLNVDYITRKIAELEQAAGTPVTKPDETIKKVAKAQSFTDEQRDSILNFFIQGGDVTAGGVAQAITAYAQTVDDGDAAFDLEARAVPAMHLAATLR
ncbi:MAG TPA: DUF932 domain-containing protein [Micromonosporaceae bacterium]